MQTVQYLLDNREMLLRTTKEFGTPLYVYDGNIIERQYNRLTKAFAGVPLKVKFAMKSLSNQAVLKLLKSIGCGVDCVSFEEVQLALRAGFEPNEILFTPNSVGMDEVRKGIEAGVQLNIDNISILEQFGHDYGSKVPCCIRLNPHIMAGGNLRISTGHIDSKFGISIYQLRHVERIVNHYKIKINGLHVHTGSDILDPSVFLRVADLMFETAQNFPDLEFIDFGSGFKVAYKEDDVVTDIEDIGQQVVKRFNEFCKGYGRQLDLMFEPGKFLVSESGFLLVSVNIIKQTMSTVFAGVNSGQNHLIRPMFYDSYHHVINLSNPEGTPRIYSVVGYICETDTLAWDRKIGEIREGDILAFCNAGAYGFTMSNNYNSRVRPAEVLILDGKPHLIRKRETLDDILRNQVDIQIEPTKAAAKKAKAVI
jgi:diaminopimelate decarboxylase